VTRSAEDDTSIQEEGPHFVRTGHFQYESGDHGNTWLTLELLFVDPQWLRRAAERLCERLVQFSADVVCGPLVGGALVAQPVAEILGARFVYADRRPAQPALSTSFHRPYAQRSPAPVSSSLTT
jgi:orotate phosphoribosyltransferase